MRHIWVFLGCSLFLLNISTAQTPKKSTPSDIYHAVQKLNFLGTALYIAAHPDDENTRLISYLSNNVHARTGYLSLTRGDGGQNLIGPELRELLGVLRTQELLAARRIDGGEQFFTRANDFGYSKHPKETLEIWNKEAILGDVVTKIREFKPDVIINRFDHRSPGSTHGHHTSSAMLSLEAFDLANDPTAFSDRLNETEIWQPRRLFFNTSWWFYGSEEAFEKADKSNMLNMDVGTYYPILGVSNNEIAALASSQHLCQGFGRLSSRGSQPEYVELLKGDLPKNKTDLFDGIDTSWNRIAGGAKIAALLVPIEKNFNFKQAHIHLPQLVKAYNLLQEVKDEHWKALKSSELKSIITAVIGLHLEAFATAAYANPGESVSLDIEMVNRSPVNIKLKSVRIANKDGLLKPIRLEENIVVKQKFEFTIPQETNYTSPYWLMEKGSLGTYKVADMQLIGKPETPKAFYAVFELEIDGIIIPISKPIVYKYAKPDKGEIYQPFEIVPEAT
ncbi:MAG: LmbE family N-acetylglucosaminyl deacetylase, partial [Maribacter sp.]